ncbi:unnamed protein product [Prorocentrum cordatum]|uniref:Uncharacterized protein n=1 Tax=Prorocentrum cordatum TaxID=2364126 RepID=A0ABN9R8Y7_9DINO|nr:unnamed protein product [Polarella glacialis]
MPNADLEARNSATIIHKKADLAKHEVGKLAIVRAATPADATAGPTLPIDMAATKTALVDVHSALASSEQRAHEARRELADLHEECADQQVAHMECIAKTIDASASQSNSLANHLQDAPASQFNSLANQLELDTLKTQSIEATDQVNRTHHIEYGDIFVQSTGDKQNDSNMTSVPDASSDKLIHHPTGRLFLLLLLIVEVVVDNVVCHGALPELGFSIHHLLLQLPQAYEQCPRYACARR